MERYNEYKDSGVQWLGEIPSHWVDCKLRRLSKIVRGGSPRPIEDYLSDEGYNWIKIGDTIKGSKYITSTKQKIKKSGLSATRFVHSGDLILTNSMSFGNPYILDIDGCIHDGWLAFSELNGIDKEYLYYVLVSDLCGKQFKLQVDGGVVQNLNIDKVKDTWLALPPIEEQSSMVAYLDTATAKIDEAIAQQQKMIDLLNERKQIIINNAVTKGLNPDAPMKDSGVDWIGEICKNWRMYRLKHLLKTNLMYGANESAESEETSYPRYIRITDIDENGKLKPDTFRSLEPLKAEPYLLTRGDILFARSGATAGKTYLFDEDIKACFAGYLIKAQVSNKLLSRYLMYYTRSGIYDQWKNSIFIQATIQNIGADKYANLRIPLPTIEEQKTIVSYLDTETMKIDKVLDTHKRQISLLQERKQIIINDVVTGKVKVL